MILNSIKNIKIINTTYKKNYSKTKIELSYLLDDN